MGKVRAAAVPRREINDFQVRSGNSAYLSAQKAPCSYRSVRKRLDGRSRPKRYICPYMARLLQEPRDAKPDTDELRMIINNAVTVDPDHLIDADRCVRQNISLTMCFYSNSSWLPESAARRRLRCSAEPTLCFGAKWDP